MCDANLPATVISIKPQIVHLWFKGDNQKVVIRQTTQQAILKHPAFFQSSPLNRKCWSNICGAMVMRRMPDVPTDFTCM
jgi:hypothetical protein